MARIAKPWEELTEEQKKNRIRNERAKNKKENVFSIDDGMPKKIIKKESVKNPWSILSSYLIRPNSVMNISSIALISSYLVYQFYLSSDIFTGMIVEFLSIIFAILLSMSVGFFSRFFSSLCLVCVIGFSAIVLHDGLSARRVNDDFALNSLKTERQIIVDQINQLNDDISNLPSNFVSRKNELRSRLPELSAQLSNLSTQIKLESKPNGYDISSLIIRVLCMIANMLLVHSLVSSMRKNHVF